MTRKKKTRICEVKGQTLEDCIRHHNWIHQGRIRKNTAVFVPLSDDYDYDNPSLHDARRILEDGTMQEEQNYSNFKK
jgi:hypothetical protein